ncbi:MAG: hypothetical protein Ta2A_18450 [Treponemataceae bacterium]|nr:MAG: hypothetical protein Ta2A_18450 [Treponemataceae bacterium]
MRVDFFIEGIVKHLIPNDSLLYKRLKLFVMKKRAKKASIPQSLLSFQVKLVEHCNLNCKSCFVFSPIAKTKFLSVDTFARDCERLSKLTDRRVGMIALAGGEPLLHPKITEIFDTTARYFDKNLGGGVVLVTNGILLLKQPETFWQSCKKNRISIVVTKYPINLDFHEMQRIATKYKVKFEFQGNTELAEKTMFYCPLDASGSQKDSIKLCTARNGVCSTLQDGKLYTCYLIPAIDHFNSYFNQNFEVVEDDYIDIYKVSNITQILEFLSKSVPFCRYCNIKEIVTGIKWGISKKDISEWI